MVRSSSVQRSETILPYYSFVDILNVKKVPAVFDGKIVLIGYTGKAFCGDSGGPSSQVETHGERD
jgi:CHASE2 domain-containing sensor protein